MDRSQNIKPFKFVPYLRQVLWGGERIAQYKGITTDLQQVGESWEVSCVEGHESVVSEGEDKGLYLPELIYKYRENLVGDSVYEKFGERFPLLVKLIDAKRDLSLQVHPNDELARLRHNGIGKTEMWYIIDAEEGALIYSGLAKNITKDDYRRMVADGSIMDVVAQHTSHVGDLFSLPAGRIHAIGAGNLLAEVQQTSNITYRVYDFGRIDINGKPRELHTELAMDAIDYAVHDDYKLNYEYKEEGDTELLKGKYFDVHKVRVKRVWNINSGECDSFRIIMCLGGRVEIVDNFGNITGMHQGETILVPAVTSSLRITGDATLLTATV